MRTTAEVAIELGVTTGYVRQLAAQRGLGKRSALGWLFTADDISQLRVRDRAGRPQNQLSIELDRVIDQSVASGFELPEGCRLDKYAIARRVGRLIERGLVAAGDEKKTSTGRMARSYWPVEKQGELL